jgi:hypothetical protein
MAQTGAMMAIAFQFYRCAKYQLNSRDVNSLSLVLRYARGALVPWRN